MVSSQGLSTSPCRASTLSSYLRLCAIFSTDGSAHTARSRSMTVSTASYPSTGWPKSSTWPNGT